MSENICDNCTEEAHNTLSLEMAQGIKREYTLCDSCLAFICTHQLVGLPMYDEDRESPTFLAFQRAIKAMTAETVFFTEPQRNTK